MYLRYVTLIEYVDDNGRFKYSINRDNEKIYIFTKKTHPYRSSFPTLNRNLLTQTELFKKYKLEEFQIKKIFK